MKPAKLLFLNEVWNIFKFLKEIRKNTESQKYPISEQEKA